MDVCKCIVCWREGSFWVPSVPNEKRVLNQSRQNDRLRVMLVLVHIDITLLQVPAWHGGTLNSRRAASPLVRLVEGEERWEASDHP
ncbi:hypothetical protein TNCV_2822911 [Trichonephila clavipes]|nr:hypothetical protein TNCV_2822911 [Trichonephila clavipes]